MVHEISVSFRNNYIATRRISEKPMFHGDRKLLVFEFGDLAFYSK